MIPKEIKYILYYGDVRGDVLPPPDGTNTSCSVKPCLENGIGRNISLFTHSSD